MQKTISLTLTDSILKSAGFNNINDFIKNFNLILKQKMPYLYVQTYFYETSYGDVPYFNITHRHGYTCLNLVLYADSEPENDYTYQDLSTDEFEHFAPYFEAFGFCFNGFDLRKVTYLNRTSWTNMIEKFNN